MQNQKVDNQLNLAMASTEDELKKATNLQLGYNPEEKTWEVIVKYNGDVKSIGDKFGASTEILTNEYAIMTIKESKINSLALQKQIEFVEKPKSLALELDKSLRESCINTVQNFPPYKLKGEGVLLGIIDSGIDYAHPDFINEDRTTRIAYIWDQTIEGDPPRGFLQGTEYSSEQINEALKKTTSEERYKIVPSQDFLGHGTHVAGIAGGNGRASNGKYVGVAPKAEFIIVKLGQKGAESFSRTTELMRAVKYVIEKAEKMGKPIVVNLSFGNNDGSHDGNSLFVTYLNTWANRWKNVIVVATGNEGASGHHTSGVLKEDEEKDIEFTIGSGEKNINVQLWKNYADTINISITAPNGTTTGFISPILGTQKFKLEETKILLYYGEPTPYNKAQQIYIEMIPSGDFIDSGIWTLTLKAENVITGKYDIWLPISIRVSEQTVFTEPTVETTLTIPSTAAKIISVGAYNAEVESIAPFSGRGYTRETDIKKPDLVAPGEKVISTIPGGEYDALSGTSMAAPFVTGSVALMMQWGIVKGNDPFLYGEKIKAHLIKGAKRQKNLEYPNKSWGYGSLCLYDSFSSIKRNMLRQEHKENTDSLSCNDIILSDDYIDIITVYEGDIKDIVKRYNADCYQVINNQYAILHIKVNKNDDCMKKYKNIPYQDVPNLFGLYDTSSLQQSGILAFHNQPYIPLRGQNVIIGIVDTGIDYTHPVFVYEDNSSKILDIWDQTIQGKPPEGFLYGTEYTRDQINKALQSENPSNIVPEKDEIGHGTFLAGVSAGLEKPQDNFVGAAPDSDIIMVKLKSAKECLREYYLVNEGTIVFQSIDIINGIKYLVSKANEYNKPIVILLGCGSNEGAHDGTSIMERYLANIGNKIGRVVIISAGNEANTGHHLSGEFDVGDKTKKIEVNVIEGEKGFTITIWNHAPDKMAVAITSPAGEYIEKVPVRLGKREEIKLVLEKTTVNVEYQISEERTGDQAIFIRLEDPTPGLWTITLFGELIVDGRYDAWLPREDWINKGTVFLTPDPYTTVTVPSTSIGVITTGAYNHINNSLYLASGRGLTRDEEMKPDLTAPGVNVYGPLPNKRYGKMTGTSISAAITAGAAALLLEWGIINKNDTEMNTLKVRNYLIRGARRKKTLVYPNREWGYGELNLMGSFKAVRGEK